MTVGVFDGLHLGHRELIERIVRRGPNPTVVTFRENPKKVISADTYEGDIFSLKQKLAAFEQLGVNQVILIDFSENFSKLRGREFLDLLANIGRMVFLVVGSNFRCGYRQDTGAELIREINARKGIPTDVVGQVALPPGFGSRPDRRCTVSSSRIRSAITEGNMALVKALTGRNMELDVSGIIPDGAVYDLRQIHRIVPASGRYAVRIQPGCIDSWADVDNGKIFLSGKPAVDRAESLEFLQLNEYPI